ncbi:MAG: MFS transporter [Desulfobacter sp.]|nr:MAG: MFS transporter [Desulfobacter sp.]
MDTNKAKRYGWSVVAASWLAVFCLFGYRATFAILKGPMSTDLGWSQAQVTLGYSLMMVFYAVTAFFSGMILDKWGTKPVYAIAAVLGALGFYTTSMISSHLAYLLTFGLIAGVATGMLWVTSTVSVRKWYVGKSYATMWGIAFAGAPMAQFILAYITRSALQSGGADAWRGAMQILSVIILVALAAAVALAKRSPEAYEMAPFGEMPAPGGGPDTQEYVWEVKEAFSKYAIWAAIFTFLTSMMGEFLIWTQVVSYWTADLGWTRDTAVGIYAVIGVIGIFSMPLMGVVADKVVQKTGNEARGRKIMLIIGPLTGVIACLLLLMSTRTALWAYAACFVFAVYWAIVPGGVVGYTGAIYGRKTLGKIWGLATLIVMGIGPFTGSFIGGWLKDISGSYTYSIYFALGSFAVSIFLAMTLPLAATTPEHETTGHRPRRRRAFTG